MVSRLMRYYFLVAIGGATAIMLLFYFADQGVLGMAAKYADDEPKLIKFMSDMGYPKTGEWCGEFAASIIKRAGGTPPSGAAIASNWRGYGTPDGSVFAELTIIRLNCAAPPRFPPQKRPAGKIGRFASAPE